MNFTEIDFNSFSDLLKSMKKEIEADLKQNPQMDDESRILLDSINILIKELKGIGAYDDLSFDKKKIVVPHLSLVFLFTRSLYEDEDLEDEEMMDWEFEEDEEMDDEEEEVQERRPLTVKSNSCCGGHDHHSLKPAKGKK